MSDRTITIAGEPLEHIEAALDLFELAIDDCGCLTMTATLPRRLGQCLNRALKTITAEMAAGMDFATFAELRLNPMDELFRRVTEARDEDD